MRWLAPALALWVGAGYASSSGATGVRTRADDTTSQTRVPLCELRAVDARSQRELGRWPLNPKMPEVRIAFEHSVLGTTVIDRYRFTPQPVLVEEEFEGEGYGLPAAAQDGEQLLREGSRQRLLLHRPVAPLTVRALPAQRMRLLMPQGELLLASLGAASVTLDAPGCPMARP